MFLTGAVLVGDRVASHTCAEDVRTGSDASYTPTIGPERVRRIAMRDRLKP